MTKPGASSAALPTLPPAQRLAREIAAKASDVLPLCDFLGLLLAGYFSLYAYAAFAHPAAAMTQEWQRLYTLTWIAAGIAPFVLYEQDFAASASAGRRPGLLSGFARRLLTLLGLVAAIAFAGRWLEQAPAGWIASWLVCALLLTTTSRTVLAACLRRLARQGTLAEMVAVVGSGALADSLVEELKRHSLLFGTFDDRSHPAAPGVRPAGATVEDLIACVRSGRPDRILIALPAAAQHRLPSIVEHLRPLGVPVELCPQNLGLRLRAETVGQVGDGLTVMLLADRPIKRWNAVLKATEDAALSTIALLTLLPLLACIALAIRFDSPGPILFRQRRHGYNNCEFDIYKFRTMHCSAEASGQALQQTMRGDSRVTRVGRFLRKWSLDELPQIFNVLEGSMSLVGPRPHAVNMRTEDRLGHEIADVYRHRHRVKPGITGWSQINGARGATDTVVQLRRRIELDLHYVENWSLLLDLRIMSQTFREVLRATNAY